MITSRCESPQFRENLALYRLIYFLNTFYSIFAVSRFTGAAAVFVTFRTQSRFVFPLPLFRRERGYESSRFTGGLEVSRGVRLISCHFAASLARLDVELGSKPRDETVSHRVAWNPLKLLPRRQFRLFRDPLSRYRAAGQLSGAICIPGSRPRAL